MCVKCELSSGAQSYVQARAADRLLPDAACCALTISGGVLRLSFAWQNTGGLCDFALQKSCTHCGMAVAVHL